MKPWYSLIFHIERRKKKKNPTATRNREDTRSIYPLLKCDDKLIDRRKGAILFSLSLASPRDRDELILSEGTSSMDRCPEEREMLRQYGGNYRRIIGNESLFSISYLLVFLSEEGSSDLRLFIWHEWSRIEFLAPDTIWLLFSQDEIQYLLTSSEMKEKRIALNARTRTQGERRETSFAYQSSIFASNRLNVCIPHWKKDVIATDCQFARINHRESYSLILPSDWIVQWWINESPRTDIDHRKETRSEWP